MAKHPLPLSLERYVFYIEKSSQREGVFSIFQYFLKNGQQEPTFLQEQQPGRVKLERCLELLNKRVTRLKKVQFLGSF